MEEFYSDVDGERLDADVNGAIIDGTWPDADDVIKFARQRIKDKHDNIKQT